MEKKDYKSNNRKVVGEDIKILMITILSFYFYVQFSFGNDISIWPIEIMFDYEPGHSNDAVTIKIDNDHCVPVPEWLYNDGQPISEKLAYIKGQTNRKIKVKFSSNTSNMNFLVKASIIYGTGIGQVCESFVGECDISDEKDVTFYLSGSLPSSVGIRTFKWKWEATALPLSAPYCPIECESITTTHTYYTLLAAPQDPMDEPWTSVLDFACSWASGQSTNSSSLNALTTNLYTNSGLDYNGGQSHYYYEDDINKFVFHLTDFLNQWIYADCQDCSMFLSILTSSIGASLTQTRRIEGDFYTKDIEPIGPTYGWITTHWNFHHIGWLNNVYDPAIKLKKSSEYIPIDKNIDNPYKIDLYDSSKVGTWDPQNAFRLGQTDPYFNVPTEIQ
jgi:hypothetical protein